MPSLTIKKPPNMPDLYWDELLSLVAAKAELGFATTIKRTWFSKGRLGYWRAELILNGVSQKYYWREKRQEWVKS